VGLEGVEVRRTLNHLRLHQCDSILFPEPSGSGPNRPIPPGQFARCVDYQLTLQPSRRSSPSLPLVTTSRLTRSNRSREGARRRTTRNHLNRSRTSSVRSVSAHAGIACPPYPPRHQR
jgi:hypothetical protein